MSKCLANNVTSYWKDMVQNEWARVYAQGIFKSYGPVLLSIKLLPFLVNQRFSPSAMDKFNETALRRMVPAVTSLAN